MAREYNEETRGAVMAALLTGQSVSSVAREYSIPKATISAWKRRHAGKVAKSATQKEDNGRIGALVITYLESSLESLHAQTRVFADPVWLKQQDASQLAVLHGVQMDKAARLLELLSGPATTDG